MGIAVEGISVGLGVGDAVVPAKVTLRIRLFVKSAIYTLPETSTATPTGFCNPAAVAGPLSPEKLPVSPLPAMVVIIPVDTVTLRTRLLPVSAMYTLPIIGK